MNQGQSKPETASVRIRENTMALVLKVAEEYNVKNVDVIDAMAVAWCEISDEHRDDILFGPEEMETLSPPIDPMQANVSYKPK
tara:strand:+ start:925 stop:1173 length:249 start_codon:yes stop_codon:yes gene_type:complete